MGMPLFPPRRCVDLREQHARQMSLTKPSLIWYKAAVICWANQPNLQCCRMTLPKTAVRGRVNCGHDSAHHHYDYDSPYHCFDHDSLHNCWDHDSPNHRWGSSRHCWYHDHPYHCWGPDSPDMCLNHDSGCSWGDSPFQCRDHDHIILGSWLPSLLC